MKKCIQCQVVFHSSERTGCLYCGCRLSDVDEQEAARIEKRLFTHGQSDDDYQPVSHAVLGYLMGAYFRAKTFGFSYRFSRNQFKIGKKFRRPLVQPIDATFLLKLPWIVIDLLDSLIVRFLYNGYCPECDWKYKQLSSDAKHDPKECAYNKEYTAVLDAVVTGKILKNDEHFERIAKERVASGARSAYHDLCAGRRWWGSLLDVLTIMGSMGLIIFLLVKVTFPIFARMYRF